uniref:B30.2/SPRY domain-containing protein n=1 Tax=Seriola dumerili TaxID=41447 RepID=A0A3B4V5H0_SERDU
MLKMFKYKACASAVKSQFERRSISCFNDKLLLLNTNLKLSDNNRTVSIVSKEQPYPDHPDRFDLWPQLLCRDALTGRCYWEVELNRRVYLSVTYRGIRRKGDGDDCAFGQNNQSWSLIYTDADGYCASHNKRAVPVYVDCPAGTLSFYRVFSDALIHIHTFNTTFTEPLYPGFRFTLHCSSVSLCSL